MLELRGKWCKEIAEMPNRIKDNEPEAFRSRQVDRYRMPYGSSLSTNLGRMSSGAPQ